MLNIIYSGKNVPAVINPCPRCHCLAPGSQVPQPHGWARPVRAGGAPTARRGGLQARSPEAGGSRWAFTGCGHPSFPRVEGGVGRTELAGAAACPALRRCRETLSRATPVEESSPNRKMVSGHPGAYQFLVPPGPGPKAPPTHVARSSAGRESSPPGDTRTARVHGPRPPVFSFCLLLPRKPSHWEIALASHLHSSENEPFPGCLLPSCGI